MRRRRHLGLLAALCLVWGVTFSVPSTSPAAHAGGAVDAAGTSMTAPRLAGSADRPNIVLISADDMRADDIKFMPRTRKLLGQAGVTFTNALSNNPLCCPARATLLTGQYSHNNGIKGNEYPFGGHKAFWKSGAEHETLPVWLRRTGYNTGFIGKYLNHYGSMDPTEYAEGPRYIPPGWNDWHASVGKVMAYYCPTLNDDGKLHRYAGKYQTDLYTHISKRLIAKYSRSKKPFFLWESHLSPHLGHGPNGKNYCQGGPALPTPPAKRHEGMFAGMPLPASPASNEADMSDKGVFMRDRPKLDLKHQKLVHEGRLEALQSLDESVADTVLSLKKHGLLGKTMIMFISDNGWLLGEHRAEKKILPYEESLTVPMLIRGPGLPAGVRRHQPVGLVDITATAVEASGAVPMRYQDGASVPGFLDGVSLTGMARDPKVHARRVMPIEAGPLSGQKRFNATTRPWLYQGVRSQRFSYIGWLMNDSTDEEFYNLHKDPFQLRSDEHETTALAALRAASKALQDCAGIGCIADLPANVDDGTPAPRRPGDHTAPRIANVHAPTGWSRNNRPVIRYTVSDPDNPARSLRHWCSHQAIGCHGKATLRIHGEGWQNWTIYVTDKAGNVGSRYGSLGVDLRPPRVSTRSAGYQVSTLQRAPLSWRVTDSASGVRDVDVRRRTAPLGGAFTPWSYPARLQNRKAAPRSTGLPARNGTVCLEVRARDGVGRQTAWTGTLCRARAIDAAGLASSPAWRTVKRDGWYAGTATATRTQGAALTVRSTGAIGLVRVVALTGPGMGRLNVTVGGQKLAGINLDRSKRAMQEFVLPAAGLSGQVRATVTSTDRPVWVDSVGVVRGLAR